MNNDAAEKKIRLYEADRALRNDSKFRDILSYILSQEFDPNLFGSRLQKARKAARITQCNLGEGIGVTGANICKLEKGRSGNEIRKGIRVDQLCYFCDALNVTPEYLLGFTENPTEHIVSESSERSAVLEAWNAFKTEKNPENQVRAIDPIYSDAPEVAAKVKFIIHSLWSTHFLLLFNLVRLAKKPIVSYEFTCRMFAESFVGKKSLPSCSDRDELIPVDDRTAAPYIQMILPAKVRPQTDFEKWTNDLRTASIYSFRKSLDAGCDVLQVEYQKRQYIANEILNLCSFNSTGECKISLSDSIGQEQLMLMPDYMVEYYSNLQRFFLATKTLRMQAEDAFEIVLSKEHSPRLLSFKDFDKTSNTVSFDLKRVCRLTHDYVFYLYKLYLEYRGRQPFQTINLIRQEDTSLPVMYNKKETGQYLSFRSVPIPDKSNRKNWCWVIDAVELNRVLMLLELPTRSGNDDIVLKDESVELRLEQNKKIRIVKAKEKVRFEAV